MRKTLSLLILSLLCACGGGAKDTPSNQTSAGGGTVPTPSGGPQVPTEFRLMETLRDNHSVVRFYQSQEGAVYTGLVAGQEIASDLAVGNLTVHGARNTLPNDQYSISGRATTSRGTDLNLLIRGLFLNSDGTEYVTRMFVSNSNGNNAYFVQGTPASSLPSGSAAYKGFAEISRNDGSGVRQEGNFELWVNFNQAVPTGRITASTEHYIFTASDVTVDPKTAELQTMNALIGHKLGQQKPAHIHGNILGLTGQGVGGIVLSTEIGPEGFVGAFLGKK